jgi:hypothetical protein
MSLHADHRVPPDVSTVDDAFSAVGPSHNVSKKTALTIANVARSIAPTEVRKKS